MVYEYLGEGNKFSLSEVGAMLEENEVGEGQLVELELTFSSRFSNFEGLAASLDTTLRHNIISGETIKPWPGKYQVVFVDPERPVWYIRYRKGIAWIPIICGALIALAAAWIAFVAWRLLRAIAGAFEMYPWVIPVVAVGVTGTIFLNALKRPAEVRTIYRRL